jgi:hypothetical protein
MIRDPRIEQNCNQRAGKNITIDSLNDRIELMTDAEVDLTILAPSYYLSSGLHNPGRQETVKMQQTTMKEVQPQSLSNDPRLARS